ILRRSKVFRGFGGRVARGECANTALNEESTAPWLSCTRGRPADQNAENQRASLRNNPRNNSRLYPAWPPMKWSPDMEVKARSLMTKDGPNADDAARVLGLSRRTMFRGLRWFATVMNLSAPTGLCSQST